MVDGVITLWEVLFDQDSESYVYLSIEKAEDAIRTFADIHIDIHPQKDEIIDKIIESIKPKVLDKESNGIAIVVIGDSTVTIRRLTLDRLHPIHRALSKAHPQVNEETRQEIEALFSQA